MANLQKFNKNLIFNSINDFIQHNHDIQFPLIKHLNQQLIMSQMVFLIYIISQPNLKYQFQQVYFLNQIILFLMSDNNLNLLFYPNYKLIIQKLHVIYPNHIHYYHLKINLQQYQPNYIQHILFHHYIISLQHINQMI